MRVKVEATVCPSCGREDLAVHQAGRLRIVYCTTCGFEQREAAAPSVAPWTRAERAEDRARKRAAMALVERSASSEPIRVLKRRLRERIDARNALLRRSLRRR
jgi:Zn ribbon nucleic-acid-binding protein